MKILLALALSLLSSTSLAGGGGGGTMRPFQRSGYELVGAEYWPFVGDEPFRYPEDVLWGFYPTYAKERAVQCAEKAYRKLERFLASNPPLLKRAVRLGAVRTFYLWTNDYTEAAWDRTRREARLWHWSSGAHDWGRGHWKWESTLTQGGICRIPEDTQIQAALEEAVAALDGRD